MADTPTDFLNQTAKAVIDSKNGVDAAFSLVLTPGAREIVWHGNAARLIGALQELVHEIEDLQARSESKAGTMPLRIIDPETLGK